MDVRNYQIINSLYKRKDFIDQDELSLMLGISTRTLRDLMKDVRNEVEQHGASVVYKNNLGYHLEILRPQLFEAYIKNIKESLLSLRFDYPVTQKERCDFLIRRFLVADEPIRSDDLCEELGVSKTTFSQDLKLVKLDLEKYSLKLQAVFRKGLCLKGSEQHIQRCMADYFFYNEYAESESFSTHTLGQFCQKYETLVKNTVIKVLDDNQYCMTDLGMNNLVIHILITLFRNDNDLENSVQIEHSNVNDSSYALEKKMAEEIGNLIYVKTGLLIRKEEYCFIAIHMIGSRLFTEKDENLISLDTLNLVREMFDELNAHFHINFFEDFELFGLLCMHTEPMIQRLKNGIPLRNPLLQMIKVENPTGYDLAVYSCHWLSNRLNVKIDDNEIGYLALHFGIALERMHTDVKKKILAVCASGTGTSKMLQFNLEKIFKGKAEKIETAGLTNLSTMDLDQYDLIVTTVPLHIQTNTRIIQVNYILSSDDHNVLSHVFDHTQSTADLSAFQKSLFMESNCTDPSDLLHVMVDRLSEVTSVPDHFYELTMKREKISSTYMGNGVAVPHPSSVLLNENRIAVVHMKKGLTWFDGNYVEWIFLLGMKKGDDSESLALVHSLYALISSSELMCRLKGKCDFEKFISIFQQLYSANDETDFFD